MAIEREKLIETIGSLTVGDEPHEIRNFLGFNATGVIADYILANYDLKPSKSGELGTPKPAEAEREGEYQRLSDAFDECWKKNRGMVRASTNDFLGFILANYTPKSAVPGGGELPREVERWLLRLHTEPNSWTVKQALEELSPLFASQAAAAQERAEFELEHYKGVVKNYENWFVKHQGDSLMEFLELHAPSPVYDARVKELAAQPKEQQPSTPKDVK